MESVSKQVSEVLAPRVERWGSAITVIDGQLTSDAPRLRCYMCSMFAEDHPTTVCHQFVPPVP